MFQCPHCEFKATKKGKLQTHIKTMHKLTKETLLQKHVKSVHGEDKSEGDFKTEYLSEDDDMQKAEYFETDVKPEVDSDIELQRSKVIKHESLSENDKEGMEEYFERDVKSEVR